MRAAAVKKWLRHAWQENMSLLLFIGLMFIFRSAIADWNDVPTGSMKPTIVEGDRILVNKMAYDIRVPFTTISLIKLDDPVRGDIIVFDSKVSDKRLVKRVIGVPGDVVEMRYNRLLINHQALPYRHVDSMGNRLDMIENLHGVEHFIRTDKRGSNLSSFAPVTIPANAYLALGDNRDNSADSRVIGLIPREEIVGRSRSVVLSLNYDNYLIPRAERFFKTL